ncbi:Anhydro-N-acetylmuramic acid kinase [compost metagenome]
MQATLTEFTVSACCNCAKSYENNSKTLAVCGGGALNTYLMKRLQLACRDLHVVPTDVLGLPAMQVEAAAFAWLARQTLQAAPGNLASVTGAAGPRVLGAVYPA